MNLSKEQMDLIRKNRRQMIERFRQVPESGAEIEYLGKNFIVYKNVFWPHDDSKALVENFYINQEETVLDLCTGCGVIAIFSAFKGASRIVAVDINPGAIKSARANAERFGFKKIIDTRLSDMFAAIKPDEKFDVI